MEPGNKKLTIEIKKVFRILPIFRANLILKSDWGFVNSIKNDKICKNAKGRLFA
jgi:hypothetical protein